MVERYLIQRILIKTKAENFISFDRCTSHYSEDIFILNDSTYSLILPGLTRFIQPSDVSINKLLKTEIHNRYTQLQIKTLNC